MIGTCRGRGIDGQGALAPIAAGANPVKTRPSILKEAPSMSGDSGPINKGAADMQTLLSLTLSSLEN